MSAAFLVLLGSFLLLGALGVPIGYAMLASGIVYLFATGRDVGLLGETLLNGLFNSFVLLAVPLFIFAGAVMNASAVTDRLLRFCLAVVGRLRGGLAHVNVVSSLIFSGMSGSALADAAGIGKLMIDAMRREDRYSGGFAAALTAASATIGPIVPPSIPMVLYALVTNTSIGYLFLGGVLPGAVMALALMLMVAVIAHRRGFPKEPPVPLREIPRVTLAAFPALLLPVILLGAIYGGATTPTEAAAVAAAYALLLASALYRALSLAGLYRVLVESTKASAIVTIIIAGAFVFNYVVAIERLPNALAALLDGMALPRIVFFLSINLLFLLLGCVFDATTMLLVMIPLLMPSVRAMGIDPVHFGVVIVVNIMIGLITPPYGVLLFVINGLTGIPLRAIIAELWPFLSALLLALLLLVAEPAIVLWLPRQFGYLG